MHDPNPIADLRRERAELAGILCPNLRHGGARPWVALETRNQMTGKPVLLTVDDDEAVSQALTRDLRRQYAQRFRVVRADSGPRALDILRELRLAEEEAVLLLADHRMPGMTGVEFLEHSLELYPIAKRVLLTA